jgi:hypothetical protein
MHTGESPSPAVRDVRLTRGVDKIRMMVRADGADFAVREVTGTVGHITALRLDLRLESANCAECVLPAHALEAVCLSVLSGELPELTAVQIEDPRDQTV